MDEYIMNQPTVSLIDVSSYLPGEPVGADYYRSEERRVGKEC